MYYTPPRPPLSFSHISRTPTPPSKKYFPKPSGLNPGLSDPVRLSSATPLSLPLLSRRESPVPNRHRHGSRHVIGAVAEVSGWRIPLLWLMQSIADEDIGEEDEVVVGLASKGL